MSIGGLRIEIFLPGSFSLKGKRKILSSLKQRVINNFSVSISEIEDNEVWNKSTLDIAIAAKNLYNLEDKISKIKKFLMEEKDIEIIKIKKIYGEEKIESI